MVIATSASYIEDYFLTQKIKLLTVILFINTKNKFTDICNNKECLLDISNFSVCDGGKSFLRTNRCGDRCSISSKYNRISLEHSV